MTEEELSKFYDLWIQAWHEYKADGTQGAKMWLAQSRYLAAVDERNKYIVARDNARGMRKRGEES